MSLFAGIEGVLAEVGELLHNEASVDEVKKLLKDVISTLDGDDFEYMATIQPSSFGTTSSAHNLTTQHAMAQRVMWETMQGFKKDMHALLANVTKASEVVSQVDQSSGTALKQRQALLEALRQFDAHNNETAAHHYAVNHPNAGPGAPATGGAH
jgi:hypothetical protein